MLGRAGASRWEASRRPTRRRRPRRRIQRTVRSCVAARFEFAVEDTMALSPTTSVRSTVAPSRSRTSKPLSPPSASSSSPSASVSSSGRHRPPSRRFGRLGPGCFCGGRFRGFGLGRVVAFVRLLVARRVEDAGSGEGYVERIEVTDSRRRTLISNRNVPTVPPSFVIASSSWGPRRWFRHRWFRRTRRNRSTRNSRRRDRLRRPRQSR